MTLGDRLKALRRELGLSQEAFGAQGVVSAPGWIKIENGGRQASEKLITRLCQWLVNEKHLRLAAANALQEELLTLKYLENRSPFVRQMAHARALQLPQGAALVATRERVLPKRGRPAGSGRKTVPATR